MSKRVAVVASHVIQYQDPFFRLLAADPEIDLTVLYCSRAGRDVYRDADMEHLAALGHRAARRLPAAHSFATSASATATRA